MMELEVYLVGGAVGDELLGRPVADRDWVVIGASPAGPACLVGALERGRAFGVVHTRREEEAVLVEMELRVDAMLGPGETRTYGFRELWQRAFDETPEELRAEPKEPKEMQYAELGRFINAIQRSGGTAMRRALLASTSRRWGLSLSNGKWETAALPVFGSIAT